MTSNDDSKTLDGGTQAAGEKPIAKKAGRSPVVGGIDSSVFSDVDVSLTAILGEGKLTVRDMLELDEGSVVDLGTPLDGSIDLVLNNRLIAQGEIVAVGDKFGVRISKIVAEKK